MTKSTTFLLALALLAPLFIATSPAQAAPIPSSPSSSPPQHTKRGAVLDSFDPMIEAFNPFTYMFGQGLQAESAELAGATDDVGTSIQKQTGRAADITQETLSGAAEGVKTTPENLRNVAKATPL